MTEDAKQEHVVLECEDGARAVLRADERSWSCESDPLLERFLNTHWRLRDAQDTLAALAERLRRAVKRNATVELRRD